MEIITKGYLLRVSIQNEMAIQIYQVLSHGNTDENRRNQIIQQ